ncbi:hypothetical protein D9M72_512770 [compost metagenome]
MAQRHAAVLDRFDIGGRNVDHHVAAAKIAGHRLQANEVGLELAEAGVGVDVDRLQRVFADDAISREAMASLEALDRAFDVGIEGRGDACRLRQVTGDHQALAKLLHRRIRDAELELDAGLDHRPAALRNDVLVVEDCLLHVGDRFRAEDRRVRNDRRRGARCLGVVLVVPGAAAWRIDDLVQGVLCACRAGDCHGAEGCYRAQKGAARECINSILFRHIPTIPMRWHAPYALTRTLPEP